MSMSRSEIITTLQGEYALKRERNQRQLEERERRVRERSPEIGRRLDENRALLMDSSRGALKLSLIHISGSRPNSWLYFRMAVVYSIGYWASCACLGRCV